MNVTVSPGTEKCKISEVSMFRPFYLTPGVVAMKVYLDGSGFDDNEIPVVYLSGDSFGDVRSLSDRLVYPLPAGATITLEVEDA